MTIEARVTCASDTGACDVSNARAPCRCHAHDFDRDAGRVAVYDGRLADHEADATVVYSLNYASEFELCGQDVVVFDDPAMVTAVDGPLLYRVDPDATLVPDDAAPLVSADGESLVFEYAAGGGVVQETHTVLFRDAMEVTTFGGIPCCGTPAPVGVGLLLAGAVLVGRRRGRPGPG